MERRRQPFQGTPWNSQARRKETGRSTMAVLTSRQLTKRFGGLVAINQLDLDVEDRSIHSVIGPNGAGKTTFFNCVTGFYRAEEGSIVFSGIILDGMTPDRIAQLGIARTYQNIRLFTNMTALENILVGMHTRLRASWLSAIGRTPEMVREEQRATREAVELLQVVGLRGKGDFLAKNLPMAISAAWRLRGRWRPSQNSCCWTSPRRG